MRPYHHLIQPLIILAGFVLTACTTLSNQVDISGSDKATFPALEITYHNPDDGPDIMLRTSKVDGAFTQTLPDQKYIEFPNATIYGPTDLQGVADIRYTSLALGFEGTSTGSTQGIPPGVIGKFYIGLNQTELEASFSHPTAEYRVDDNTTELYVHVGVLFPVRESLMGGFTFATSTGPDVSIIDELDIRIDYRLSKHVGIMAGYRKFEYFYNVQSTISDIALKFRGLFAGLGIQF